jgi:MATE family multidrug resistance protein
MSDGLQAVGAGVLRGIKDTRITGIIAFVCYWVIMIPGAYYLCFYTSWGINGIWIAFVVGLTLAAVLLMFRFNKMSKPHNIHFEHLGHLSNDSTTTNIN